MKIKETVKGNIQITMSKEETDTLYKLLNKMTYEVYLQYLDIDDTNQICKVWNLLVWNQMLFK